MFRRGFSPVIVVIAISLLALVPVLNIKTTATYSGPAVKGVLIAKGDNSGEGGPSGGSSSGFSSPTAINPGVTIGSTRPTVKIGTENKKPEKAETKEFKAEIEIGNEIEKLDKEVVDIDNLDHDLGIEFKGASTSATPGLATRTASRSGKLKIKVSRGNNQTELEIQSAGNQLEIQSNGVAVHTNFPLSFDKTTNQIFVRTPNGPKQIRVLPDQLSSFVLTSGTQTSVDNIELVNTATGSAEPIAFSVRGKRVGNLLGVIPVTVDVETQIGAQTGQILATTQPFWFQLLSPLVR